MSRIAITRIEVCNCGPWRGHHEFTFAEQGLCVFCAPNETGKTTLLRLIPAVLWGREPPARNWLTAEGDWYAAVEFRRDFVDGSGRAAGGQRRGTFRVTRDFAASRVSLTQILQNGQQSREEKVYQGKHRERGRTADQTRWLDQLSQYFASISPDAFCRLAVLIPPFEPTPEAKFIQSLISGAGEKTKEQASATLLDKFRRISRFSRQAGLAPADARNLGQLEELKKRYEELSEQVRQAQRTLEQGVALRERLEKLDAEMAELQNAQQRMQQDCQLLDRVRQLQRDRRQNERRVAELRGAIKEWQRLDQEQAKFAEQMASYPAVLRDSSQTQRGSWRNALGEYHEMLQLLAVQQKEVQAEALQQQFVEVWTWPADAPQQIQQWESLTDALRQAEAGYREAQSQLEGIRPIVDRKRQRPVLLSASLGVGLLICVVVSLLLPWWLGLLAGGVAGGVAAVLINSFYRPTTWPPAYAQWQRELAERQTVLQQRRADWERAQQALTAWAGESEPAILHQRLGRFQTLCEARERLRVRQAEVQDLREKLSIRKVPQPIRQLCGLPPEAGDEPGALLNAAALQRGTQLLEAFEGLLRDGARIENARRTFLNTLGVQSIEELAERANRAKQELDAIVLEIRKLCRESPLAEEAFAGDAQKLENKLRQLRESLAQNEQQVEELRQSRLACERELARWEGAQVVNVAQIQEELRNVEEQIKLLDGRKDAVAQAFHLIEAAYEQFSAEHRAAIETEVNRLMRDWTGRDERSFLVDQDFAISFTVAGWAETSQTAVSWQQLSQGTQDQLALAIRWAILDRVAGDVILPLLLDDCFHVWDAARRENLRHFLENVSDRQVILVTHDANFSSWGQAVTHCQTDA